MGIVIVEFSARVRSLDLELEILMLQWWISWILEIVAEASKLL